jgi:hypothetical protein
VALYKELFQSEKFPTPVVVVVVVVAGILKN